MTAIDPHRRWEGPEGKPEYAGFLSFAGLPYSESPEDLDGVDVAVVGAPIDELVSDRPGTRFGPRAVRAASGLAGPQLDVGVDALEVLRLLDYGDAPIVPADPVASHAAIERTLGEVLDAGAIPLVLGGDHSIVEPEIRACAAKHGPVGLVHFDTHTDTGAEVFEAKLSHGTPMYRLVEAGQIDAARYVQIGLRGYWPGEAEFAWQAGHGITALPMRAVFERGIADVVAEAIAIVDQGPTFVSVDVDVLDPAYAPGTGTPEPGGMTSADLLWAAREVASRVDLVGADVVEVLPTLIGSQDITALVAGRIARELLTGIAIRRAGD